MTFNIKAFVRENKVIFIWLAFAGLLYLFRDLFALVFITFIMCFLTHSVTDTLGKKLGINRRLLVVAVYLLFLVAIGFLVLFALPRLAGEAKDFGGQIPASLTTLETWASSSGNNLIISIIEEIRQFLTPEQVLLRVWDFARTFLEKGLSYTSWFILGIFFSFLIMMDLPKLVKAVRGLQHTRLAEVYRETADSVVLFAKVVGENFRAQLIVSAIDTALVAVGLSVLGVNAVVLLCTLFFFAGLIPVLGVFISGVPIFLMAVNTGGISLGLWSLALLVVIHSWETYFLSPRIVSSVMSLNPVITLIILYIAYSLLGLWGMLLGIPISVYIYRQIIQGSLSNRRKAFANDTPETGPEND